MNLRIALWLLVTLALVGGLLAGLNWISPAGAALDHGGDLPVRMGFDSEARKLMDETKTDESVSWWYLGYPPEGENLSLVLMTGEWRLPRLYAVRAGVLCRGAQGVRAVDGLCDMHGRLSFSEVVGVRVEIDDVDYMSWPAIMPGYDE